MTIIDENRKYADKVRGAFPCITLPVQDVLHVEKRCTRCSGEGEIVHYMHVQRGICFACNGTTVVRYMVYRNSSYWTGYFDYAAGLESWHCPFASKSAERSWHMGHTAAFEQEYADNICLGRMETPVETFPDRTSKDGTRNDGRLVENTSKKYLEELPMTKEQYEACMNEKTVEDFDRRGEDEGDSDDKEYQNDRMQSAESAWHDDAEEAYYDNDSMVRDARASTMLTKHSKTYTGKCKLCPEQVERVGDELCNLCIDFATRAARGKCSLCATPTKSVGDEFCEQCAEFEGHQHLCECGREYIDPFEVRCSSCKYRL